MPTSDLGDYAALFLKTAQEHIIAMENLLSNLARGHDPSTVARDLFRHAHSLKGSSSVMSHESITAFCTTISELIHPDADTFYIDIQDLETLSELISNLKKEVDQLTNTA